MPRRPGRGFALGAGLLASLGLFSWLLFAGLGHPLLWNDEGDTAVFAQRVLDYGYPKAHGEPPILYNLKPDRIDPASDAYRGGLWGYYYFGALGAWLSSDIDDLHARTGWFRLPFALAGWFGVLLLPLGLLRALGSQRTTRAVFGISFLLLSAASTSLLLHLREARWYGLALLLVSASLLVFFRHFAYGRLGRWGYSAGLALLLFGLFNTFHPLFAALGATLAIRVAAYSVADEESWGGRLRAFGWGALPLALAVISVIPIAVSFDLWGLSQGWVSDLSGSARSYVDNLRFVLQGMFRFEFLAAALVGRMLVLGRTPDAQSPSESEAARLNIASTLTLFFVVHVLLLARSPLVWERYFIVLSPCLIALLVLDAVTLWERARVRVRTEASPIARHFPAAVLATCVLASVAVRAPELAGRVAEIRTPVEGPLDRVIPYLRARHAPTQKLVIATNYEGPVLSWYLGSHVVLGYYGGNLERDREANPDILLWRPWPRRQSDFARWSALQDQSWEGVRFDVRNTRTNNMPSLWRGSPGGVRHRFATQRAHRPEDETVLLVRAAGPREAGLPVTPPIPPEGRD